MVRLTGERLDYIGVGGGLIPSQQGINHSLNSA